MLQRCWCIFSIIVSFRQNISEGRLKSKTSVCVKSHFYSSFSCSKTIEKSKLFSTGRKKFNMDPKKVSRRGFFLCTWSALARHRVDFLWLDHTEGVSLWNDSLCEGWNGVKVCVKWNRVTGFSSSSSLCNNAYKIKARPVSLTGNRAEVGFWGYLNSLHDVDVNPSPPNPVAQRKEEETSKFKELGLKKDENSHIFSNRRWDHCETAAQRAEYFRSITS